MKKILLLTLLSFGMFSCSNEDVTTGDNTGNKGPKGSSNSTSSYSDYNVTVTQNADGSEWTYTITKSKANSKNLSHFIIDLKNCGEESATFSDIIWATVNGAPADMSPTEGSGTGCNPQANTTNFIKFNTNSGTSWVIVIKFDRGYEVAQGALSWIKAGTSCNTGLIPAPGCPREDYCSFSQGFFFANGAYNNGASEFWANGLTIGGITYTQAQGMAEWDANTGVGSDAGMRGFFQLGALLLSGTGAEAGVAPQAALIEAYFTGLDVTTVSVLPASNNGILKSDVSAASGIIGEYIDANHCE